MYAFLGMPLFWIRLKLEFEFGEPFISSSFRSLVVRPILSEGTTRLIIPSLQASSAVVTRAAQLLALPVPLMFLKVPDRAHHPPQAPTRPAENPQTATSPPPPKSG